MKAAVCYEYGKPLVVEEVEIEAPQAGEIKVQVKAASICHSDVSIIRGEWGSPLPIIAGHEASGIVESVGEGVTLVKPGDAVVISLLRSCGRCSYCTTGSPYACDATFALDKNSRLYNEEGDSLNRGLRTAAFAEHTIVHESQAAVIPKEMPFDLAALLPCAVITGVGSVINTAKVRPNESVVIIGAGGVGLNAIQGAVISGAYPVIAVDVLDSKLNTALDFGATHSINGKSSDPVEGVMNLTSGKGVEYVFVTVGVKGAARQGFDMTCKKGTVIIIGQPEISATVSIPIDPMIRGERRVMGCPMGSGRLSLDIMKLVSFYQQGRLKLEELITQRYPLTRINDAIESLESGEALRNVIIF